MSKAVVAVASALCVAATSVAAAAAGVLPQRSPHVQQVGIVVLEGDHVLAPNIALAPGVPVRLVIRNDTTQFHTFTISGLHVSALILPARGGEPRTTVVRFTPHAWGTFAWHCVICPTGMHGRAHAMGGELYVMVDPSTLP